LLLNLYMRKEIVVSILSILLIAVGWFFLKVAFKDISDIALIIFSIISFVTLFISARDSWYSFILVFLSLITITSALGVSFGSVYTGDAPIRLNLVLSPIVMLSASIVVSWFFIIYSRKFKSRNAYPLALLILFVLVWIVLAFNTTFFEDWKLENYLTVPFVIIIFIAHKWFRLSNISYTLIFLFMAMHIYGSHYTYSEVPFGFWLQDLLNSSRNHYDRIVHFSFGLLLAYPLREMILRIANAKGVWGLYIPVDVVLALSALYEILEWATAAIYGGDLGIAYLGSQGDVFDAQKDMALAGTGSIITMLITFFVLWVNKKEEFGKEFKESFKVKKHSPLGEQELSRIVKRKKS